MPLYKLRIPQLSTKIQKSFIFDKEKMKICKIVEITFANAVSWYIYSKSRSNGKWLIAKSFPFFLDFTRIYGKFARLYSYKNS